MHSVHPFSTVTKARVDYTEPMSRRNYALAQQQPLYQAVNFYVSVAFIATFGFFMSITVVQAFDRSAPLVKHIASPVVLDYDIVNF